MLNRFITTTELVVKGHGFLTDLDISGSVNDQHTIVYDGTSDKGDIIAELYAGDSLNAHFNPRTFPRFNVGLYVVVAGTTPKVNIGFRTD